MFIAQSTVKPRIKTFIITWRTTMNLIISISQTLNFNVINGSSATTVCLKRQRSLVNLFQTRFAFASQIDYLCRRESVQMLSLFSCLNATKNIKSLKVLAKSYEISIQHASDQPVKCVRLQAYMTRIARQHDANQQTKSCKTKSEQNDFVRFSEFFLKIY